MAVIVQLRSKEILDSRGAPTIEVAVRTEGAEGTASVPAGASTGSREDKPLPVPQAIANVHGPIADAIRGKDLDQRGLDTTLLTLDGTPNESRLGANAILAVSMAFARAAAAEATVPLYQYLAAVAGTEPALPCPMFNVLNGGKHARNGLDIQEFLLVPTGVVGAHERLAAGVAAVAALKTILEERSLSTDMGDEGGFAPALTGDQAALDLLVEARARAGFDAAQVRISLDAAASSTATAHDEAWWLAAIQKYDLLSLEDPFVEDNQAGFVQLQQKTNIIIVGDDLTTTNAEAITTAAAAGAIRGVVLKPNQAGSVSETIDAAAAARAAGLVCIASHRSGETMDPFIADLAVGLGCEYLKAGAPTKPERMAKYNRLMEIASEII